MHPPPPAEPPRGTAGGRPAPCTVPAVSVSPIRLHMPGPPQASQALHAASQGDQLQQRLQPQVGATIPWQARQAGSTSVNPRQAGAGRRRQSTSAASQQIRITATPVDSTLAGGATRPTPPEGPRRLTHTCSPGCSCIDTPNYDLWAHGSVADATESTPPPAFCLFQSVQQVPQPHDHGWQATAGLQARPTQPTWPLRPRPDEIVAEEEGEPDYARSLAGAASASALAAASGGLSMTGRGMFRL